MPVQQSELLAQALKTAKVDIEFQKVSGAGHDDLVGKLDMNKVAAFFDRNLKSTAAKTLEVRN